MLHTLISGAVLSILLLGLLLAILYYNPRLLLQRYPPDVQRAVPPKTAGERRQTAVFGGIFLLLLLGGPLLSTLMLKQQQGALSFGSAFFHAGGVLFIFNLADLLLLDWLIFCTITPRFVVLPGTAGLSGYKDYRLHLRGFVAGTVLSVAGGSLIAVAAQVL
jgi:hypothetical protein